MTNFHSGFHSGDVGEYGAPALVPVGDSARIARMTQEALRVGFDLSEFDADNPVLSGATTTTGISTVGEQSVRERMGGAMFVVSEDRLHASGSVVHPADDRVTAARLRNMGVVEGAWRLR